MGFVFWERQKKVDKVEINSQLKRIYRIDVSQVSRGQAQCLSSGRDHQARSKYIGSASGGSVREQQQSRWHGVMRDVTAPRELCNYPPR